MRKKQEQAILLVFVLIFLVQAACTNFELTSLLETLCQSRGDTWRSGFKPGTFEVVEWCESKSVPTPIPTYKAVIDTNRDCIVPVESYSWSYEDYKSISGSSGVSCQARFLFKNNSDKPVSLYLYSSWDNNAMNFTGWDRYSVQPEGEWEKPVNHTIYTSKGGGVTFSRVNRMVVLWDAAECRVGPGDNGKVPEDQDKWIDGTPILNDIPCP